MLLLILLQRITTLLNEKKINTFISTRQTVSENTKLAYFYDLRAFIKFLDNRPLTQTLLTLFQIELQKLAPASQHRKITHINRFLKYLYQSGDIDQFFELPVTKQHEKNLSTQPKSLAVLDFSSYYQKLQTPGEFILLLIIEFGLKPSEIQTLRWHEFNWEFKILTVKDKGITRVLPIRDRFARLVRPLQNADELFSKSRQFLYYELKKTTPLTAKELREQYNAIVPGWHMNKKHWNTVFLDGTVPLYLIKEMIKKSYFLVRGKK